MVQLWPCSRRCNINRRPATISLYERLCSVASVGPFGTLSAVLFRHLGKDRSWLGLAKALEPPSPPCCRRCVRVSVRVSLRICSLALPNGLQHCVALIGLSPSTRKENFHLIRSLCRRQQFSRSLSLPAGAVEFHVLRPEYILRFVFSTPLLLFFILLS
jgi:hypothetical protein